VTVCFVSTGCCCLIGLLECTRQAPGAPAKCSAMQCSALVCLSPSAMSLLLKTPSHMLSVESLLTTPKQQVHQHHAGLQGHAGLHPVHQRQPGAGRAAGAAGGGGGEAATLRRAAERHLEQRPHRAHGRLPLPPGRRQRLNAVSPAGSLPRRRRRQLAGRRRRRQGPTVPRLRRRRRLLLPNKLRLPLCRVPLSTRGQQRGEELSAGEEAC